MIATRQPTLAALLTPDGRERWDALEASATGGARPESKISRDFWTIVDRLGHEPYASAVARFIRHRDTRSPLTIGIAAAWGAGKTSMMRMVQEDLDPRNQSGERGRIELTSAGEKQLLQDTGGSWFHRLNPWRERRRPTNGTLLALADSPTRLQNETIKQIDVAPVLDGWRPTVWFNPWMYENVEQVWAGLAHEIISQVTNRMNRLDRENFWLRLNLRRIDGQLVRRQVYGALLERLVPLSILVFFLILMGAGLALAGLLKLAGIAVSAGGFALVAAAVIQTVSFLGQKASATFGSLLTPPSYGVSAGARAATASALSVVRNPEYESRLGLLHLVQGDMKAVLDLVATSERPLVVFVDDLDRCSPGAVAQVVEAINLFLAGQFPNCIFVIALEPSVVATHIEVAYKALVDGLKEHQRRDEWSTLGWRFLDKIVQLPLRLPAASPESVATYINSLLAERSVPGQARGQLPQRSGPPATDSATGSSQGSAPDQARVAEAPFGSPRWEEAVTRLTAGIRQKRPGVAQINAAARQVQSAELGISPDAPLVPVAREAARRVLDELFRDDNAEVRKVIVAGASRLVSYNPREIKRFVNLFRFYSVISAERAFAGRHAPELDQVAKLAVLAIRWPQLLNVLAKRGSSGRWLEMLEEVARESEPTRAGRSWDELILVSGLAIEDSARPGHHPVDDFHDLRDFLAADLAIGGAAEGIL